MFSLVQIFNWLVVERDPKFRSWLRPLHWKYVRYSPDSSISFLASLKTLAAMSSVEECCPNDGQALLNLVDLLFAPPVKIKPSDKFLIPQNVSVLANGKKLMKMQQRVEEIDLIQVDRKAAEFVLNKILNVLDCMQQQYDDVRVFVHSSFDDWVNELLSASTFGDRTIAEVSCTMTSKRSVSFRLLVSSFSKSRWTEDENEPPQWQNDVNTFAFRFEGSAKRIHLTIDRKSCHVQLRDPHWRKVEIENVSDEDLFEVLKIAIVAEFE